MIQTANKIRVAIRVRPTNDNDRKRLIVKKGSPDICVNICDDGQTIKLERDIYDVREFKFDRVFGPLATHGDIYIASCASIVRDFTDGYDGSILAYGQTGTGKTFTMFDGIYSGKLVSSKPTFGILYRALTDIFQYIERCKKENRRARLFISFYQIYLEKVSDLLYDCDSEFPPHNSSGRSAVRNSVTARHLNVREDPKRGTYVEGLSLMEVFDMPSVLRLINSGVANRVTVGSAMNSASSRSHALLNVVIEQQDWIYDSKEAATDNNASEPSQGGAHVARGDALRTRTIRNVLTLGDLAGSERMQLEAGSGLRVREGRAVNQSICSLGKCIRSLAEAQVSRNSAAVGNRPLPHIPYRDSTLTRVLANSLGGNCYTAIICNIGPCLHSFEETLNTLSFAGRAAAVKKCVSKPSHVVTSHDLLTQMQDWKWPTRKIIAAVISSGNNSDSSDGDNYSEECSKDGAVLETLDDIRAGLNLPRESTPTHPLTRVGKLKIRSTDDEVLRRSREKQKACLSRMILGVHRSEELSKPEQEHERDVPEERSEQAISLEPLRASPPPRVPDYLFPFDESPFLEETEEVTHDEAIAIAIDPSRISPSEFIEPTDDIGNETESLRQRQLYLTGSTSNHRLRQVQSLDMWLSDSGKADHPVAVAYDEAVTIVTNCSSSSSSSDVSRDEFDEAFVVMAPVAENLNVYFGAATHGPLIVPVSVPSTPLPSSSSPPPLSVSVSVVAAKHVPPPHRPASPPSPNSPASKKVSITVERNSYPLHKLKVPSPASASPPRLGCPQCAVLMRELMSTKEELQKLSDNTTKI